MKRPSAPMVVSLIALVFSMSGGALAAHQYLLTSINQIRPGVLAQIRSKAAVVGPVGTPGASGSPGAASTVPGPEGRPGAAGGTIIGPPGESVVGPQGEAGPRGGSGSAFQQVREYEATSSPLAPGEHRDEGIEARCPEGSRPIGGGYVASEPHIHVWASAPAGDWGWDASAINESATNEGTVTVQVLCAE